MAERTLEKAQKVQNPSILREWNWLVVTKKQVLYVILYGLLLAYPVILNAIAPGFPAELVPPFHTLALWALPLFILSKIRNVFSHLISFLWILWFVIGSINLVASYDYYGSYYLLDAEFPTLVYIFFLSVFLSGMYLYEKFNAANSKMPKLAGDQLKNLNPIFSNLMIVFPFIWFAVMYASLGYVPIISALQGEDLVTTLYKLDYGPLYGFALINVLAMLVALEKSLMSKWNKKWPYLLLMVTFVFISVSTGKRDWFVIFMLAALVYLLRTTSVKMTKVIALLAILGGLYVGIEIIRSGVDFAKFSSISAKLLITGHEYRTFAYVVNHLQPGEIVGYDWAASTLAATLNSTLLRVIGFDKQALVELSSAYSWRYIFSTTSELGIRGGIISELYMAYGFQGSLIFLIFGIIVSWVSTRILQTKSKNTLLFLSIIYGMFMLAIVDTTANITGSLTVLMYVWLFYSLIRTVAMATHFGIADRYIEQSGQVA